MHNFLDLIGSCPLFAGVGPEEIRQMLQCLGARGEDVPKDGFAMMAGDTPDHVGVVLAGELRVLREDAMGGRALLATLGPGDLFAEALACAHIAKSPVSVVATQPSRVLRLAFGRILSTCPSACAFHAKLVENMLGIVARKSMALQSRMEILEQKSIRGRILRYLLTQGAPGEWLRVPLDRNALADYLAVDRSALSRELSRMAAEGVLAYKKSEFRLLVDQAI